MDKETKDNIIGGLAIILGSGLFIFVMMSAIGLSMRVWGECL